MKLLYVIFVLALAVLICAEIPKKERSPMDVLEETIKRENKERKAWNDLTKEWGKRFPNELYITVPMREDKKAWTSLHSSGWGKRAWTDLQSGGWGKRSWTDLQSSGWGKRAWTDLQSSGWGKRAWTDLQSSGWGKRAWGDLQSSGWGKRDEIEEAEDTFQYDKRNWDSLHGGWGKRAADWGSFRGSWGKRDPAWQNLKGLWGKRSYPITESFEPGQHNIDGDDDMKAY